MTARDKAKAEEEKKEDDDEDDIEMPEIPRSQSLPNMTWNEDANDDSLNEDESFEDDLNFNDMAKK